MKRNHTQAELIEGRGGVFKVWKDRELLWDKHAQGRFPEPEEILERLERRTA
jgi:predicted Rdx family selenoprotein